MKKSIQNYISIVWRLCVETGELLLKLNSKVIKNC